MEDKGRWEDDLCVGDKYRQEAVRCYYEEVDPSKRRKILDQLFELEGETDENLLRRDIYEKRYRKIAGTEVDCFIRGIVTLRTIRKSFFGGARGLQRDADRVLKDWRMEQVLADNPLESALVRAELYNAVRRYLVLCEKDPAYNSVTLGMGRMQEDSRIKKMAEDLKKIAIEQPRTLGRAKDFEPFTREAAQAFGDIYPAYAYLFRSLL